MKKLSIILIAILLLLNIQVSAETYDSITITNPDGAIVLSKYLFDELGQEFAQENTSTLKFGDKLTNVSTECQRIKGLENYVSGVSYSAEYYVKKEDTSLEQKYVSSYESVIITNPAGSYGTYIPKDGEMVSLPGAQLPMGTKLTNVKPEESVGSMNYVSGFTDDGNQYKVLRDDTSLENIYPPVDEEQIVLANTPEEKKDPLIWPWIVLIIAAIIGFGILSAYLKQPQCPKCKSRGSREVKRQFLNSEKVLFKEEERIKEYANKGKSRSNTMHKAASNQYVNPPTKIIVREKLVEGTREYYNVTYQCNKCGEQFTRKEYVDRKQKIV